MNALRIGGPILALVATAALGLGAGWFARTQTMTGTVAVGSPSGTGAKEAEDVLDERALKNMGVTIQPAAKGDHVVCRDVLGVIEELPTAVRSVSARWGGTVSAVLPVHAEGSKGNSMPAVVAGRLLKPGDTVVEILRSPMPFIERKMTGDVVQTVSETVHDLVVELRASKRLEELASKEYERVRGLNRDAPKGLPVIPRQTEINLQYEMVKAHTQVERLEGRLLLHGFTTQQIQAASDGATLNLTADVWRRALERNGLWPATGKRILSKLPAALQTHPWTYAALGELSALGKCDDALAKAVNDVPELGTRFQEAAALLQAGHSLTDIVAMVREGALDPVVRVRAPEGAPIWEVREVRVKPGEKIEPGDILAIIADNRRMILELEASGTDTALVEAAMGGGAEMEGLPLVKGAGPMLKGIRLTAYKASSGEGVREPRAYALVTNERMETPQPNGDPVTGAWRLRPGMRYRVQMPVHCHSDAFVLPRDALVNEGHEKLVYLRSGKSFKRQPVHVLFEDRESVVVADDGAIFPGDPVVTAGAFPLSLALRATETRSDEGSAAHKHGPTCQH